MKGILVGLGGRANSWLQIAQKRPDVEFDSYVEPVQEQRDKIVQKFDLPQDRIFDSLEQALEASDAQYVMDITPPVVHEQIATAAMDAGLHVIEEKPLSDDLAAARRMVDKARATGLVHMITQNYRFGPLPRTTRRLLQDGVIGDPEQVLLQFFMNWADRPGSHYVTQPFMLIKDMGIHHFDLLRYVLNEDVQSVLAHTWNPSWGWHQGDGSHTAIFQMGGGITATHHSLASSKGDRTTYNGDWHIAGSEGSITWEGDAIFVTHGHKTANPGREEVTKDAQPEPAQDAILTEFFSAIREGRQPECNTQDNLKSLEIVFATIKSAQDRRWINLDEI